MIKGVTRSGFEFEVAEDIANDMELFEALTDLDNGDLRAIVPICRTIIGDRKKELYDHLRGEDGRVPIERVSDEIVDILTAVKDGKK